MRAVDTNILARWILQDDPAQVATAAQILREPVFVSGTVLLELGWVLQKRLGMSRDAVAGALEVIVAMESVQVLDTEAVHWAIDRYRQGADWGDMLHLLVARDHADSFATFDQAIAKVAGPNPPVPVDTLA